MQVIKWTVCKCGVEMQNKIGLQKGKGQNLQGPRSGRVLTCDQAPLPLHFSYFFWGGGGLITG